METRKQLQERFKKLERKYKKLLKGCGDECEKGGTCYHMSRDKKLLFNKDLTDSKLERVRMYCNNCKHELTEVRGQLRLLKEILGDLINGN